MIKVIAAAAAAALVSVAGVRANAADIYGPGGFKDVPVAAPAPVWTGYYGGVNIGAAWSTLGVQRTIYYDGYNAASVPLGNLTSSTGFVGGQFGYNWQFPGSNYVLGFEADLGGIGGNAARSATAVTYDAQGIRDVASLTVSESGGFAGDVTGRLGYAWGDYLLYAKGGFAWFNPNLQGQAAIWDRRGVSAVSASTGDGLTGWTIGAGVEWMLNLKWSVKAEYLYYDFGVDNARLFDGDLTVNTVKLGLNYHLTSCYNELK